MSISTKAAANLMVRIRRKWLGEQISKHCTFFGIFSAGCFERHMTKKAPAILRLIKSSAYYDAGRYTSLLELTRKL